MINYEDLFINKIYGNLLSHQRVNDDNLLKINIAITNDCNQKCEYCIANTPNIKNKYYINKEYIKFLFKYLKINNFDRKFRINLLGGEPTLHTELNDIIDSIKYNYSNNIIKLFTNGSQSIDYYKNMINKYNNLTFYISYHPEFANTNKYIDILNMFKNNNPNNIYYVINILLVYEYYDKILDFINKANDINGNINFILLFGVDYVNTKYNIFNDIINNMKNNSEFLEYKLTFDSALVVSSDSWNAFSKLSELEKENAGIFKNSESIIIPNPPPRATYCLFSSRLNFDKPTVLVKKDLPLIAGKIFFGIVERLMIGSSQSA